MMHPYLRRAPSSTVLLALLFLFASGVAPAREQLPEDRGAAGLLWTLRQLNTDLSVLHITAHPDDEDAALLTYLARGLGARTMLLSLTRGEGGANVISSDFFDALGILRTLELLEADRRYGVEQFFTLAADYGYSKTLDEALRSWGGEERVLDDVVRVVRSERPDIIIARFRGDPRDGHGHHQLAGLLAERAFAAAGDPARFPEQIAEGLAPWQPVALFGPASRSGGDGGTPGAEVVSLPTGRYDPVLGRSYAQLGREGYGLHRSQGMAGSISFGGPEVCRLLLREGFRPLPGGRSPIDLFSGAPVREPVDAASDGFAREALATFSAVLPEQALEPLVRGLRAARAALEREPEAGATAAQRDHRLFLLRRRVELLERAIALALGLEATALTHTGRPRPWSREPGPEPAPPFVDAVPGQSLPVRVRLLNRSRTEIRFEGAELEAPAGWKVVSEPAPAATLGENEAATSRFVVTVAEEAAFTWPHWSRGSIAESFYQADARLRTLPLPPPPVEGVIRLRAGDEPIVLRAPLENTVEDASLGARILPLTVVPALSVAFTGQHGVVSVGQREYRVRVTVRSSARSSVKGGVRLEIPRGWTCEPASSPFVLEKEGEESAHSFTIGLPEKLEARTFELQAIAGDGRRDHRLGWRAITARDLGRSFFVLPARHTVRSVDVKLLGSPRLGYVPGSGDEVAALLEHLGVRAETLSAEGIAAGDLSRFATIWIGVRAYAVRPELKTHHQRLMDYVARGGVLVVQYQTPEYDGNFAPYPYTLGGNPEEVSEEDAPVTILAPEHPLFTRPNAITSEDFEGWVEQRGSKLWRTWDERYTPLIEMQDAGQEPQRGAFLHARHGKGQFVYCALAWYRQLPHGVPGAYRIVANLLSLPAASS